MFSTSSLSTFHHFILISNRLLGRCPFIALRKVGGLCILRRLLTTFPLEWELSEGSHGTNVLSLVRLRNCS